MEFLFAYPWRLLQRPQDSCRLKSGYIDIHELGIDAAGHRAGGTIDRVLGVARYVIAEIVFYAFQVRQSFRFCNRSHKEISQYRRPFVIRDESGKNKRF